MFSLCVPSLVLEPAMDKLTTAELLLEPSPTPRRPRAATAWPTQLGAVMVPVAVELGDARAQRRRPAGARAGRRHPPGGRRPAPTPPVRVGEPARLPRPARRPRPPRRRPDHRPDRGSRKDVRMSGGSLSQEEIDALLKADADGPGRRRRGGAGRRAARYEPSTRPDRARARHDRRDRQHLHVERRRRRSARCSAARSRSRPPRSSS